LHSKALIELGLEERLDAVERPSEIAQENSSDLRKSLPEYKNNIDVFREMDEGRTLLILGQPGAGKTIFMLRIVKSLIADTEENLSLPIPVIFNLSSWANKRQNIAQWLIEELHSNYKVSKSLAKYWIQNQQLLLLLDGLDEVKAEYRDACVKVLNEFMHNYGETEIVVCSRIKDYESLSNRLAIQRGVCIQSLTTEQINDYLDRAGNQLQAVKTLLETDTALQELVKSPLMLSIITLAYKDVAIEDLPQLDSLEEHRQHLFNSYIQRMFARRGTNKVYPEEKAINWLNWLAYKMSQDSQTIFSIEQMQPRWLETVWQKLIYNIGVVLFSSLSISIIGVLMYELYSIILLKKFSTNQDFYDNYIGCFIIGLFLVTANLIILWLNNKKEIILPVHFWRWSKKQAFKGIVFGLKTGLFLGICFGLIFTIYNILSGMTNISAGEDNIFSNKFFGLIVSLLLGILFVLVFKVIKTFFSNTSIKLNIRLLILDFTRKNILIQGIFVGIFIWIVSLINHILTSLIIQLTLMFLFFTFLFGFILSCLFGIIGAVVGVQDSVDIQKEVVSVNPVKKALVNSIILTVIGGLISGLIIGGLYFLSGSSPILEKNKDSFITLTTILGIFSAQVVGFACIQHLSLRLLLYRYNYIAWNYTHFLEYATERIFLQKVGGGYIFVHRLLLEHFAALYQPSQLSSNTRLNLPIARKYQVFSLILTTILITFLGYQFRKEGEKSVQNFIEYLEDHSRQIDYYSSEIEQDPKNPENYNNRGLAYYYKKDYDRAIADYSQALNLDPKNALFYNNRGGAYREKKDYERAIADYTQAINIDPKNADAYNTRGNVYYDKKDYERAIADYTQALNLNPKNALFYNNRGGAYREKKDYERAIADYSEAIKLDQKDKIAYENRGLAYEEKEEYDLAIADYSKAIKLDQKYETAYNNRGDAHRKKKDYDRAIADYTQAINIDPKYTLAYNNRGDAYYYKKDYERAIADYTQAINIDPKYTLAYNNRGFAYSEKKDYDRAIADYTQAINLDPKYTLVYNNRGDAYYYKKDYDRAIADYTQAINIEPKDTLAYNNRGFAYSEKKDYDRAIADYTQAINIDPKDTLAYKNRGFAYYLKRQYDLAIADYSEAIKLDPKFTIAYNNRGKAYYLKRQCDLAIADYSEALKLDPKFTRGYSNRGDAYYSKRQYDLAIADYSEAIKLDPNLAYAYYSRGSVYKNQGSKGKAIEDFKKVLELNKDKNLSQKASKQLQELSTF
jgi:tetratricopeptide (TPR) repeat protein